VVAAAKTPVKAPAPAQPAAAPRKPELQVAAKAPEPKPAPPARAAAPSKPPVTQTVPVKAPVAAAPTPAKTTTLSPSAAAPQAKQKVTAQPVAPPRFLTAEERETTGIEVRNGTRTKNLARLTRALLSQEGFNVTKIGNHIDFGAGATVIYYRAGADKVARALNSEIFPEASLEQSSKLKKGVAIRILLGHDLLDQPQIMARLTGEEMGPFQPAVAAKTSKSGPQPQPTVSKETTTPVSLAAPAEIATPTGHLTAAELIGTLIEIRNGTRSQNLAHRARSLLSREGFRVGIIGNHIDFGAETTVIYYRAWAEKVARVLNSEIFPGAQLTPSSRLNQGMAIKVVLGRDLLDRPQLMSRLAEE
jgi:hypothetical protein